MKLIPTPKLLILLIFVWLTRVAGAATPSLLWGSHGEAYDPVGRLPDVSFAGYACGDRPIPCPPVTSNVRDFGAKGDGMTDDSAAFLAAIAKTKKGAIAIPPGRYRITKLLEITRPGVVLRGAGPERSVLVCPLPLEEIRPNMGANSNGRVTSEYSWSGGIVSFHGENPGGDIGSVTLAAKRGDRELIVDENLSGLSSGSWIEITVNDDHEKSLLAFLYSGDLADTQKIKASKLSTSFVTRIKSVKKNRVVIERPLRFDLRPEWKPRVRHYQPTVTESGIENLGFEFPARKYGGHFTELGFNAVTFDGVAHCWARNLLVINADSAIFVNGSFCTIDGLRCQLRGATELEDAFGHHGVSLTGNDNLLTHFEMNQRFLHDFTVSRGAGNVFSAGKGIDICLDHHKYAPFDNVFTDIDLGIGSRMWKHGGGSQLGKPCAARGTFWNIRAIQPQSYPANFGPWSMNLVGIQTQNPSVTQPNGLWFEAIAPSRLQPTNIHEAQLMNRLEAK